MTKQKQISLIKMAAKEEGIDFINNSLIEKALLYADKSALEQNTGIKQTEIDFFYEARLFFNEASK
tara:strand:+ start:83 stop:280 length:198 start_codon:yes stop_codon:yes gene_type:complete